LTTTNLARAACSARPCATLLACAAAGQVLSSRESESSAPASAVEGIAAMELNLIWDRPLAFNSASRAAGQRPAPGWEGSHGRIASPPVGPDGSARSAGTHAAWDRPACRAAG